MPAIANPDILKKIITGKTEWPIDYTLANFLNIFRTRDGGSIPIAKDIESLSSTEKVNLITYLSTFFKTSLDARELQFKSLKDSIQLFHNLLWDIKGFDENALQESKVLTNFFNGVFSKNPSFISQAGKLTNDIGIIAQQLASHLGRTIKNLPPHSRYASHDFLATYLNAIHSLTNHSAYVKEAYRQLADALTKIGVDCLSVESCNHSTRLSEIFTILGILYHKNSVSYRKEYAASVVLEYTTELMNKVKAAHSEQLSLNEIQKLALQFSQAAYSGMNLKDIYQQCTKIFELENCQALSESTTTEATSILNTNTTSRITSSSPEQTEITALTPLSQQTETTTATQEQTSDDVNLALNSNLFEKLGASAITGLTQGVKSELINALLKVCLEAAKNKPPFVANMIKGTFVLIDTVSTAALPILYNFAYNIMLAEDKQDPLTTSELQTSILIGCAVQALDAAFYFSPNFKFKATLSYLHMLLVAGYMFVTSGSLTEKTLTWATSSAAAITGKAAVQTAQRFMLFSKVHNEKTSNDEVPEVQELLTIADRNSNTSSGSSNTTTSTTPLSSNSSDSSPSNDISLNLKRFRTNLKPEAREKIDALENSWKELVNRLNRDINIKKSKSTQTSQTLTDIKGELDLIRNQLNTGKTYGSAIDNCSASLDTARGLLIKLSETANALSEKQYSGKSVLIALIFKLQRNLNDLINSFPHPEKTTIVVRHIFHPPIELPSRSLKKTSRPESGEYDKPKPSSCNFWKCECGEQLNAAQIDGTQTLANTRR